MAKRAGESGPCHRERGGGGGSAHIVEASLLQEYIGILIGEMRGEGMLVPSEPFIPSRDPPIRRHKTKYMPIPSGPIGG